MNPFAYASLVLLAPVSITDAAKAPLAVSCEQDTFALCAYSNCTINADLQTASCPCYELSGPSLARIDVIPSPGVKQATMSKCTDANACSQNNAPICDAIVDGSLWPGADAVSTFSRDLEVENGALVEWDGERGEPNWECSAQPVRLVPNCMLAPCVFEDSKPVTNQYWSGAASMKCTCPLIEADVDYVSFGGLQSPCKSSPVPVDGGFVQNTAGAVLAAHASDNMGVAAAWEAVAAQFERVVLNEEINVSNDIASSGSLRTLDHTDDHNAAPSPALITAFVLPLAALLV